MILSGISSLAILLPACRLNHFFRRRILTQSTTIVATIATKLSPLVTPIESYFSLLPLHGRIATNCCYDIITKLPQLAANFLQVPGVSLSAGAFVAPQHRRRGQLRRHAKACMGDVRLHASFSAGSIDGFDMFADFLIKYKPSHRPYC